MKGNKNIKITIILILALIIVIIVAVIAMKIITGLYGVYTTICTVVALIIAKSIFIPLMYRIIGKKKLYPMIAKGEYDAGKNYLPVVSKFPEVESVKNDEHRHGNFPK